MNKQTNHHARPCPSSVCPLSVLGKNVHAGPPASFLPSSSIVRPSFCVPPLVFSPVVPLQLSLCLSDLRTRTLRQYPRPSSFIGEDSESPRPSAIPHTTCQQTTQRYAIKQSSHSHPTFYRTFHARPNVFKQVLQSRHVHLGRRRRSPLIRDAIVYTHR